MRILKSQINLKIVNNTALSQDVSILSIIQSTASANGSNALYEFDLTGQNFTGVTSITIQISNTSNPTVVSYTASVNTPNIQGVVDALNSLGQGNFSYQGNIVYAPSSYYIYGDLTVGLPTAGFVSTWNTANTSVGSSASNQVKLPLEISGTYNFTVNWGDGNTDTITTWNQAETLHTYASSGTYTITITGICTGWRFDGSGDRNKILSVSSWGSLNLGNNLAYFQGCTNLDLSSVSDVLDLTGTTNLGNLFYNCSSLSTINNIGSWDVSGVTNMASMFQNATAFNQNISSWDVSNVTDFVAMFSGATSFNQSLNSWNTIGGVQMSNMFSGASSFNGNISSWDVSNVTVMQNMFLNATSFNQDISSWDVSNVTDMISMFENATAFNQNISSWDISSVSDMTNFMTGKSSANYSISYLNAIYNSWSLLTLQPNVTANFGTIQYTSASSAGKAILQGSPNNWTVTDGGIVAGSSIFASTGTDPRYLAFDSLGNLYVSNTGAGSISKITSSGVVTTFAVLGGLVTGIIIDSSDNVYVANNSLNQVNKITPSGVVTILGTSSNAPFDLVIDSFGNIYTFGNSSNIIKITPSGTSTTFATLGSGQGSSIAIDSSNNLYVGSNVNTISKITPSGVLTILTTLPQQPNFMTIDSGGNLYSTSSIDVVYKTTPSGVNTIFGSTGTGSVSLGITLDLLGNIYTSNFISNNVSKITPSGVSTIIGTTGNLPYEIIFDSFGNLYTANSGSNNISKIIT